MILGRVGVTLGGTSRQPEHPKPGKEYTMLSTIAQTIAFLETVRNGSDPIDQVQLADVLSSLREIEPEPQIRTARIILGANAYATISHSTGATDIRLEHGCSPITSLTKYAAKKEAEALRALNIAGLALAAAEHLENARKSCNPQQAA